MVTTVIRSQIDDYDICLVTREIPVRRIREVDRLHFEELAAHTDARRCTQRAIGETDPTLSDLRVFYLQLLTHQPGIVGECMFCICRASCMKSRCTCSFT